MQMHGWIIQTNRTEMANVYDLKCNSEGRRAAGLPTIIKSKYPKNEKLGTPSPETAAALVIKCETHVSRAHCDGWKNDRAKSPSKHGRNNKPKIEQS